MTAVLVTLLVVLVVLVLLLGAVVADRSVARLAERKAAEYLVAPLGDGATVRVHGEPFLSQALRGRYRDVEVTASGLRLGTFGGVSLDAHLVNAYLPLRDLLGRRTSELPVEHIHGAVVIPYAELARVSALPGLEFSYRDERLLVTAKLPVPGLSQLARVRGEALLTIAETGGVWLRVRNVSVTGLALPSLVLNQLVPTLTFPIPLPPLPYGLRLERLTPTAPGLEVDGSARAVVLRHPPDAVHDLAK